MWAPPSSLCCKVDGDKVPKALEEKLHRIPPAQSVLANIIKFAEQTHFAGAFAAKTF